jgi:hypothetical protein
VSAERVGLDEGGDVRSSSTPTRPYADPPTRFLLAFAFSLGEDDALRHL